MYRNGLKETLNGSRQLGFAFIFAIAAMITISAFSVNVSAATFVVNTTADTVDANPGNGASADAGGQCSLRTAIGEANAAAGADIITLPAGTYTQTLAGSGEDANANGDYDITAPVTINGAGSGTTIIQANAARIRLRKGFFIFLERARRLFLTVLQFVTA